MFREAWRPLAASAVMFSLAGCANLPGSATPSASARGDDIAASPWVSSPGAAWEHREFPGKKPTRFYFERKDGRDALAARSEASASMLRRQVHVAPQDLGHVRFSWLVPELIAQADMARRDAEDAPVRIVLAFDGDRSRLSPRDAMLSELARTLTGEEMPYATLMYVWCNQRPAGTVIHNPRTDRIRKLVVESGASRLNQWQDYERDVRVDYERVFGEKPGALIGVAVMTDSDNTGSRARAWYGPVTLLMRPPAQPATLANR